MEWSLQTGARGGVRLQVREHPGPADTVPVVILHGFLEQGAAWDRVAAALGRRVLAPDLRGHGRSGHTGGFYHFWDYVPDVDALVEAVGGTVDLVGHSMGGTVACLFAGTRPEAVRRLVLVEGLGPPDVEHEAVDRARAFLAERRAPPAHKPMRDVEEAADKLVRSTGADAATARVLAERTTRPVEGGVAWTWDALHRARTPGPFQASLFSRFLREITCPVLLVEGASSSFRVADADQRAACLADHRKVTIAGAGHFPHYDAPDALAAAIGAHLR